MNYTKEQLIDALHCEYVSLCHDDFDPEQDMTPEEYLDLLNGFTYDELIEETSTDEEYTIDEYMNTWQSEMRKTT